MDTRADDNVRDWQKRPAMHIWLMLENWFMQVQWIHTAPAVIEVVAATSALALALASWPRGCCKQDDLFQRKAM